MSKQAVQKRWPREGLDGLDGDGAPSTGKVGTALMRIKEGEKYKAAGYDTFVDYCRERWDLAEAHAYRTIDAAKVAQILDAEAPVNTGDSDSPAFSEQRAEWTIRPLAKVLNERGEEGVRAAWREVVARKSRQTELRPGRQPLDSALWIPAQCPLTR